MTSPLNERVRISTSSQFPLGSHDLCARQSLSKIFTVHSQGINDTVYDKWQAHGESRFCSKRLSIVKTRSNEDAIRRISETLEAHGRVKTVKKEGRLVLCG